MFEEKQIITAEQLRKTVEDLDARGEKKLGPLLIAKAWTDPAFKAKLLYNAGDAAEELGIQSSNFAPKPKAAGTNNKPVYFEAADEMHIGRSLQFGSMWNAKVWVSPWQTRCILADLHDCLHISQVSASSFQLALVSQTVMHLIP